MYYFFVRRRRVFRALTEMLPESGRFVEGFRTCRAIPTQALDGIHVDAMRRSDASESVGVPVIRVRDAIG